MAMTPFINHLQQHLTSASVIGRVGALAVALGVGAAIATTPAIASAGPTDSTNPSAGSGAVGDGAPPKFPSDSAKPQSHPRLLPKAIARAKRQVKSSEGEVAPTDGDDAARPARRDSLKSLDAPGARLARPAMSKPAKLQLADPNITLGDAIAALPAAGSLRRVELAPVTEQSRLKTAAVQAVPTKLNTPARPLNMVSRVLSLVGLNSSLANGPTVPVDSPTSLTLLAWYRRQIDTATADLKALTTSPLGTEQQLNAERLAAETAKTWPVQLMKLVLQAGWLSTANTDFKLVGGVDQANKDALAKAVDEYAMAAAFQQQILDSNDPTVVMQVAPPHNWYDQDVAGSRILYDNPDTIYRFMGVNNASTYVIKGRFTGEMPADTTFSVLTGLSGVTASVLTPSDIERRLGWLLHDHRRQSTHGAGRKEPHPAHQRDHLDRGAKHVVQLEHSRPDELVDRAGQRAARQPLQPARRLRDPVYRAARSSPARS